MVARDGAVSWVLLTYRVPRNPSTPRIAIWRRLRRLGVASLTDGLVALPEDARTREQLEWVAGQVEAAGGSATLWRGHTLARADERRVAQQMARARGEEYARIISEADAVKGSSQQTLVRQLRRLRREMREIKRRDYFPPPQRQQAQTALEVLAGDVVSETEQQVRR